MTNTTTDISPLERRAWIAYSRVTPGLMSFDTFFAKYKELYANNYR